MALEVAPDGIELHKIEVGHLMNGLISVFLRKIIGDRTTALFFVVAFG